MAQTYFSMDFAFYSSLGVYSFQDRCEITKATGYDAIHLTLWDGSNWVSKARDVASVKSRFDLDVAGVYVVLDLSLADADPRNAGIINLIDAMPEGSTIDLAIKSAGAGVGRSDPRGDAKIVAWLNEALPVAAARGSRILLYPHVQFWTERHADALRICEKINHPSLGLTFSALQWYMVEGRDLAPLLRRAIPFIRQANFSGSRRSPLGFFEVATIEPLDTGELDNFAVLALLKRLGYQGALGYNGWHEGGDAYNKLARSLKMLKEMVGRVSMHPQWGGHLDA